MIYLKMDNKVIDNEVLKTSADELYELVKSRKKISVEEVAKLLKVPLGIVQSLVDFLVEERIFGMEYKFTTPYIYLSQEKEKGIGSGIESPDSTKSAEKKIITKEEFYQKANKWNISSEKISLLWKKYVNENMGYIKEVFYTKADLKGISKEKIDNLWEKYKVYL